MDKAVEFAREILRKERAVTVTSSKNLKRDYQKSARQDREDLRFYCDNMNLDFDRVMRMARKKAV